MHSLNHQVDQHLFKITIPHYKQSFLRQRTAEPGGPASAADRKDGEAGVGFNSLQPVKMEAPVISSDICPCWYF